MDIDLVPRRSGLGKAPDGRSETRLRGRLERERRSTSRVIPDLAAVITLVVVPTVVLLLLTVALG